MTPLEILQQVRELIGDESRWTRKRYAEDADGEWVPAEDPSACKWCVSGAFWKVTAVRPTQFSDPEDEAWDLLAKECETNPVITNDMSGHAAIIAALDRAIAKAQQ